MADQSTCQQIICGAITQAEAGIPLMLDCAQSGYVGAQPCNADVCQPWIDQIEANMGGPCPGTGAPAIADNAPNPLPDYVIMNTPAPAPVTPAPVHDQPQFNPAPAPVAPAITPTTLLMPLPSITQPHNLPSMNPANQQVTGYGGGMDWCSINSAIMNSPGLALGLLVVAYFLLKKGK